MSGRPWTGAERRRAIALAREHDDATVAEMLGRSPRAVARVRLEAGVYRRRDALERRAMWGCAS